MELMLGSYVRERGRRAGRLAGFELEPVGMLSSGDSSSAPTASWARQIRSEPLAVISSVHEDGEVELRDDIVQAPMPVVRDVILVEPGNAHPADGTGPWAAGRRLSNAGGSGDCVRIRPPASVVAPLFARRS